MEVRKDDDLFDFVQKCWLRGREQKERASSSVHRSGQCSFFFNLLSSNTLFQTQKVITNDVCHHYNNSHRIVQIDKVDMSERPEGLRTLYKF